MSKSKRRAKSAQRQARRKSPATAQSAVSVAPPPSKPAAQSKAEAKGVCAAESAAATASWPARPPAKNLPLLITAAVLLAVWLIWLAWLAFSVRSQRDTVLLPEGSRETVTLLRSVWPRGLDRMVLA